MSAAHNSWFHYLEHRNCIDVAGLKSWYASLLQNEYVDDIISLG